MINEIINKFVENVKRIEKFLIGKWKSEKEKRKKRYIVYVIYRIRNEIIIDNVFYYKRI